MRCSQVLLHTCLKMTCEPLEKPITADCKWKRYVHNVIIFKWIINIYGINLLDCLNKSWLLLVRCYGMKKEEISKESETEGKKVSWKTTKTLDQEVMQCLLSIMSHLVGVPEIYPKVLIIGGSGRCGQGAAYILEKTGIPR